MNIGQSAAKLLEQENVQRLSERSRSENLQPEMGGNLDKLEVEDIVRSYMKV